MLTSCICRIYTHVCLHIWEDMHKHVHTQKPKNVLNEWLNTCCDGLWGKTLIMELETEVDSVFTIKETYGLQGGSVGGNMGQFMMVPIVNHMQSQLPSHTSVSTVLLLQDERQKLAGQPPWSTVCNGRNQKDHFDTRWKVRPSFWNLSTHLHTRAMAFIHMSYKHIWTHYTHVYLHHTLKCILYPYTWTFIAHIYIYHKHTYHHTHTYPYLSMHRKKRKYI